MILLLDLGNTNLYVGVYQNGSLLCEYRTNSDTHHSSDMYQYLLNSFFIKSKLHVEDFEGAIIASVIPSLTMTIVDAVETMIKKKCYIVGNNLRTGLSIRIDNPSELGADLVADCVGALKEYSVPCIICDLGTANKFLVLDKTGNFIGCIISPGIKTAGKALALDAAQLMDISYTAPKKVIGKNSPDSLNSGAIFGTIAMINGLTDMIEKEIGYKTNHIITGGNAKLVYKELKNYVYDPHLIFKGLYHIYQKNKD